MFPKRFYYSLVFLPFYSITIFRKATKRGKFSRAAFELDVVLNSRQKEVPEQNLSQIYDIA